MNSSANRVNQLNIRDKEEKGGTLEEGVTMMRVGDNDEPKLPDRMYVIR